MTRRRGKIAQLPKALREEINLLIEDSTDTKKIIAFLAERGQPGINKRSIDSWIRGEGRDKGSSGYNDWRQEQHAMADLEARQEFSLELLEQNQEHHIHDAARLLASCQLAEVVSDFDVQVLKDALHAAPEHYASVVDALTKLSRDNLEYEQYRYRVAEQKRKIQEQLHGVKKTGGFTPEILAEIEQALNLL